MHRKRLKMLPLTAAVLLAWAGTASALDFHGYFRSGAGASSKDGGLECFKLAGVQGNGNFRLGNECDTYGEAQFDQNVYEGKGDGVKFDYHVMFGYATPQNADFENLGADPVHSVSLTGGATRSGYWNQLRSDVLGVPVELPAAPDPAYGMAVLAASSGQSLTETARRMVRIERVLEPRPQPLEELYGEFVAELDWRGYRG